MLLLLFVCCVGKSEKFYVPICDDPKHEKGEETDGNTKIEGGENPDLNRIQKAREKRRNRAGNYKK